MHPKEPASMHRLLKGPEPGVMRSERLSYRPPMDWDALLGFLAARATPGVERAEKNAYARTMQVDGHAGVIRVTAAAAAVEARRNRGAPPFLILEVSGSLVPVLMQVCARVRRLFDLDAEPTKIDSHLSAAGLSSLQSMRFGLRVPGAVDGFELATRAILGQQVSVKGATTLMSRLTAAFGESLDGAHPGLDRVAATAVRIADASISSIRAIGLPVTRATTIHLLARAVVAGTLRLELDADVHGVMRQLMDIPGIGPWTAEYIAMRALHWPDAFPASDLVLRRNAGNLTPTQMLRAAEPWRPWRAYAAMHLWTMNRR